MISPCGDELTVGTSTWQISEADMRNRVTTGTGSQGCLGVVSGYVAKLGRQAADLTQERLAELIEVDVSTVQGWESGRRPLGAVPTAQLMRLRMQLVRLGAPASLGRHLADALEADLLLATGVDLGAAWAGRGAHPLAATVHRRSLINLVTWPFTGETPPQLTGLKPKRQPRGPAAVHPVLWPDERRQFFDHLIAVADTIRLRTTRCCEGKPCTYSRLTNGRRLMRGCALKDDAPPTRAETTVSPII
jgi:DNA-binding transcriptional regulator YiaG